MQFAASESSQKHVPIAAYLLKFPTTSQRIGLNPENHCTNCTRPASKVQVAVSDGGVGRILTCSPARFVARILVARR